MSKKQYSTNRKGWSAPVLAILIAAASPQLFATTPGGQAGAFLRHGIGARAIGMGTAFSALATDGLAGFYNVGALPFLARPEGYFSFGVLPLDRSLSYFAFATAVRPAENSRSRRPDAFDAGFSFAWLRAGVDNIDLRDGNGQHIGMQASSEHAFLFSFALKPLPRLAVGITGKLLYHRLPGLNDDGSTLTATGFGIDFGMYAPLTDRLSVAFVVKDLKSKYTWNTEKLWDRGTSTTDYFPNLYRFGGAVRVTQTLVISGDAEFNEEQGWRGYGGAEWQYGDNFGLRLGYKADHPTFGFGLRLRLLNRLGYLDYAFDAQSITPGTEQFFSLRLVF